MSLGKIMQAINATPHLHSRMVAAAKAESNNKDDRASEQHRPIN